MNRYFFTGKDTVTQREVKVVVGEMVFIRIVHGLIRPINWQYFEQPTDLVIELLAAKLRIVAAICNVMDAFRPLPRPKMKSYEPNAPSLHITNYRMTPGEAAALLGSKKGNCLLTGFCPPERFTRQSIQEWLAHCHDVVVEAQIVCDAYVHNLAKQVNSCTFDSPLLQ